MHRETDKQRERPTHTNSRRHRTPPDGCGKVGLKTSTPRRRAPRKCRCRGVCAVRGVGPLLRPELCGVGTRGRRGRSRRRAERSRLAGHGHVRAPDSPLDLRIVQKEPYENWPHSPMRTLPRAPNRCIWIFRAYNRGCVNKAALARMLGALGRVGEPSLSTKLVQPPPPGFKSAARGRVGGGAGVRVCGTAPSVGVEQRRARLGRKVASSRGTRASFFHVAPLPAGRGSKRVMGRSCSGGAADPGIENEARTGS